MKTYTLTVVLKPDLSAEAQKKIGKKVEDLVFSSGGKIEKTESLGIKTLAYEIEGNEQASFSRFTLTTSPDKVSGIRSELERDNNVLRVLVLEGSAKGI
ncbi:MAG TPA: 30S ribosomal protein S6 [candidate division WWE3 bacterium]|uniref:Small ribosomal subunit protein bS6 n=1 Tax=candidate division WWE3 bacterium TaxID=2053526 RepID=A0A7C1SXU4_UNCKA|nr:30S ribosomal protein S6 [candidate division WWE3 bacterium]